MSRARLDDIDHAKAIAIVAVVLGHVSLGSRPVNAEWFVAIDRWIYSFHMPLFLFLSGFVMYYAYRPPATLAEYGRYVRKRVERIAPGFLLVGALVLGMKLVMSRFIAVDNTPTDFWAGMLKVVLWPTHCAAQHLWYLHVLLTLSVLLPIGLWLCRQRLEPLLLLAILVHQVRNVDLFAWSRTCEYAFVFVLGAYAAKHLGIWTRVIDRLRWLWWAIFAAASAAYFVHPLYKIEMSLAAIPAVHALARRIPAGRSRIVGLLGTQTYVIYLFHTSVLGVVKGVAMKFVPWGGTPFAVLLLPMVVIGLAGPLLLKFYVFKRVPYLDKITS